MFTRVIGRGEGGKRIGLYLVKGEQQGDCRGKSNLFFAEFERKYI